MNADDGTSDSPLLQSGAPKGEAALAGILLHSRDRTREDKVVLASSFGAEGSAGWLRLQIQAAGTLAGFSISGPLMSHF